MVAPVPPTVNSPLIAGATLVSGTSSAPEGSIITVYKGAANIGTVTPPPVITPGLTALATSVSGTFPTATAGVSIDLYADGFYLGTTTTDSLGHWTVGGLSPLAGAGAILTAAATVAGSGTSGWSAPVVVGTTVHMLRSDSMTTLVPPPASLFTHSPLLLPYASLETLGPNHRANLNEKGVSLDPNQPVSPGTADDDKFYMTNVTTGMQDDDPKVLDAADPRKLIFYEMLDNNAHTLYVNKAVDGVHIVFTITP